MKTKTFFLICLLLGIGLTQLSAQNSNSTGTKTYVYNWTASPSWVATIPVFCDGVQVDELSARGYTAQAMDHYKNGELIWFKDQYKIEFTSNWTGEVFIDHSVDKCTLEDGLYCTFANLIGNKGSHYVGTLVWNMFTHKYDEISFKCL
jgi:hypothetical protein